MLHSFTLLLSSAVTIRFRRDTLISAEHSSIKPQLYGAGRHVAKSLRRERVADERCGTRLSIFLFSGAAG